jgi:GST-like protein
VIRFYYNLAPNPMKVVLFLEETGLPYEAVAVDTRKGEQHSPAFKALNPNEKLPVIEDGGTVVFDSNAILLYLAERTGRFLGPADARGQLLSWLMFVASGVGPFSGQAIHFRHFAPESIPYAQNRYTYEARRHWRVVDERLAGRPWMLGEDYSIVDMAVWGWAGRIPVMLGEGAMADFPNLARMMAAIDARPAAVRALGLKDRHAFKAEMDEEAQKSLYPHKFVKAV